MDCRCICEYSDSLLLVVSLFIVHILSIGIIIITVAILLLQLLLLLIIELLVHVGLILFVHLFHVIPGGQHLIVLLNILLRLATFALTLDTFLASLICIRIEL